MKKSIGWCALIAVVGFAARAGAQVPGEAPGEPPVGGVRPVGGPQVAESPSEPTLGDQGHWAISLERAFGFDYSRNTTSVAGMDEETTTTTSYSLFGNPQVTSFTLFSIPRVGFDAFVAPGVSVGTALGINHGSLDQAPTGGMTMSSSITALIFAPRVGYVARLAPSVLFWPRAGLSVFYASISPLGGGPSESLKLIAATVEAPFVFTLAPRVAFTFGPTFDISFSGNVSQSGAYGAAADLSELEIGVQAGLVVTL